MSVITKNPFALLNEDDEEPRAPVAVSLPAPVAAATPAASRTNNRGRSERGPRNNKPRGTAAADTEGFSSANPNEPGQNFDRADRGRTRGRGRGERTGRGGGDRPPRGRAYDKQSQTGVTDSEKQVAQGWGADTGTAELAAEVEGEADAKADVAAETTEEVVNGVTDESAAPVAEVPKEETEREALARQRREEQDEEDKLMTLGEYQAKKKADEASALPKLENERKVGAASEWKDAVQLLRDETADVYFAGKAKSLPKAKVQKEQKEYVAIEPVFDRPSSGRGGRGGDRGGRGRGGERGGRGRGGRGRGDYTNGGSTPRRNAQAAVDVDDQSAFPSLA